LFCLADLLMLNIRNGGRFYLLLLLHIFAYLVLRFALQFLDDVGIRHLYMVLNYLLCVLILFCLLFLTFIDWPGFHYLICFLYLLSCFLVIFFLILLLILLFGLLLSLICGWHLLMCMVELLEMCLGLMWCGLWLMGYFIGL